MESAPDKAARRAELIEQYRNTFSTPYVAAGRRLVDNIIEPADTRKHLAQALEYLQTKRDHRPPKKHGLAHCEGNPDMKADPSDLKQLAGTLESLRQELVRLGERVAAMEAFAAPRDLAIARAPAGSSMGAEKQASAPAQETVPAHAFSSGANGLDEEVVLVISAAIAGNVSRITAQAGQTIQVNDVLLVLEAMKWKQ